MRRLSFSMIALVAAVFTCFGQADEVKIGETLPKWQEGELDIHFISTGRGESTFMIFPDGTTFLTDAAGYMTKNFAKKQPGPATWKPNDEVTSGRAIVNYINHFTSEVSKGHINYFLHTLHRSDHMGQQTSENTKHYTGEFVLTSLCEIGSNLVMDNIYDRNYPDYSYPKVIAGGMMPNYQKFLDWTVDKNGSNVEQWAVGSSKQVVPLHDKSRGVTVRALAGNGCVATANEGGFVSYMPERSAFATMDEKEFPDENRFSCAYMLSYGKFDFFLGGDLQYGGKVRESLPYMDAETPLIPVIKKVEVMKANNHGITGSHVADFINKLAPDVWLVGADREYDQPAPGPMKRVIKANPNVDVFCLFTSNKSLGKLVEGLGIEDVKKYIVSRYGHIVVRVAPGGDSYMVYTLEDSNEEYRVKSIHGPYTCGD